MSLNSREGRGSITIHPLLHTFLSTILLIAAAYMPVVGFVLSFLEVVVDWSAKLRSLLWARNGDLACRNKSKFVFFKWRQNVKVSIACTVG